MALELISSPHRRTGLYYSSNGTFPSVVGADGVGRTTDGRRVYFVLPEAPYGALAEKTLVRSKQCVVVPDDLDDATAAAVANPGMSAWAALVERAHVRTGETILVNGATGTAGRLAAWPELARGQSFVAISGTTIGMSRRAAISRAIAVFSDSDKSRSASGKTNSSSRPMCCLYID
jgi:NADPH:quinone reductase-like Zn-dependent oxidoreductase